MLIWIKQARKCCGVKASATQACLDSCRLYHNSSTANRTSRWYCSTAEDVLTVVNYSMVYVGLWVLNFGRFISVKHGMTYMRIALHAGTHSICTLELLPTKHSALRVSIFATQSP